MDLVGTALAVMAEDGLDVTVDEIVIAHTTRCVFRARAGLGEGAAPKAVFVKVDGEDVRWAREEPALRSAAHGGVRTPRVLWSRRRRPSVLVLEAVAGPTLEQAPAAAEWRAAGAELRRLHDATPPEGMAPFGDWDRLGMRPATDWGKFILRWGRRERDELLGRGLGGASLVTGVWSLAERAVTRMPRPRCVLLHGDCQAAHVLLPDGEARPVLIDFGDAGTGDPVWDLVVLTLWRDDVVGPVLDGYQPDDRIREALATTAVAYRVLRHIGAVNWMVEHGFDPADHLRALTSLTEWDQSPFSG